MTARPSPPSSHMRKQTDTPLDSLMHETQSKPSWNHELEQFNEVPFGEAPVPNDGSPSMSTVESCTPQESISPSCPSLSYGSNLSLSTQKSSSWLKDDCGVPKLWENTFSDLNQRRVYFKKPQFDGDSTSIFVDERCLPDRGIIFATCSTVFEWTSLFIRKVKMLGSAYHRNSRHKSSDTPRALFAAVSTPSFFHICFSLIALVTIPFVFYANMPGYAENSFFIDIVIAWDSLLHTSIWPIAVITATFAFYLAHRCERNNCTSECLSRGCLLRNQGRTTSCIRRLPWGSVITSVQCLGLFFCLATTITCQLQIIEPSWIWNPLLWGTYKIYKPSQIEDSLKGFCVDYKDDEIDRRLPLCLNEGSWNTLSSGKLSSHNKKDVKSVLNGLTYAREESGGLIINVMSRDTIDAIEPLRQNVEGLTPFFSELSVVVFENDSSDGSREAFKKWASEAEGYSVDLMECDEAVDCKFGVSHRYDAKEAKDYFKSSAIGRMAEFRQRMVDYIVASPTYADYSHMIVFDLDLSVSLSPLGVLHTLGELPNNPVASAGRQVWPGSFGTLVPPYDFSAFRAHKTDDNAHLLNLHQKFCGILPAGDRWRNQCDAASPMHLALVLSHDRSENDHYRVDSAFNGATMYPLKLVRDSGARYDVGEDGQRCEHIGFNLSMEKPMFINSKWDMHINPTRPGGPTGVRALKSITRIVFTPSVSLVLFSQNIVCMILFVYCVMMLVMNLAYPLWRKAFSRSNILKESVSPLKTERAIQNQPRDCLTSMTSVLKRRNLDCDAVKHV